MYLFKKLLIVTKESKSHPEKIQIDRQFPIEHLKLDDEVAVKNRASFKGRPRTDDDMHAVLAVRNMAEGSNSTRRTMRSTSSQQGRVRYIKLGSQRERNEWASAIHGLQKCKIPDSAAETADETGASGPAAATTDA